MSDALAEALRDLVGLTSRLDHAEGYCCCGDSMEDHESPMFCGHMPVDVGEYYVGKSLDAARAALAAYDAAKGPAVEELIMTAQWARNRLEAIADESWHGDARDFKRALVGVFADFDEALAKCGSAMPAALAPAASPAPPPAVSEYRLSDKMQKLLDTVRGSSQWDMENDRMKAPAPWSPPPEADRSDGFECFGRSSPKTSWHHIQWANEAWWMRSLGLQFHPTAFAPLPSAPAREAEP